MSQNWTDRTEAQLAAAETGLGSAISLEIGRKDAGVVSPRFETLAQPSSPRTDPSISASHNSANSPWASSSTQANRIEAKEQAERAKAQAVARIAELQDEAQWRHLREKFVATRGRSGDPFHAAALGHVSRLNCWMIFERWRRPHALDRPRIFTAAAL